MKISILSCGPGLPEIVNKYGHSSEWIPAFIDIPSIQYEVIKVYENREVLINNFDAVIITGSKYSVYDDKEWIYKLKKKVKNIISMKKPVLGICFGHQILASCLGATVRKNDKGWELGSYNISINNKGLNSPLFSGINDNEIFYESHQDVVMSLPDHLIELAVTDKANQSFCYKDLVYGVQFHPEFSFDIIKKLVSLRIEKGIEVDSNIINESIKGKILLNNFIKIVKASMK